MSEETAPTLGVHLVRTDEDSAEIEAVAARLGGRIGLDGVLGTLKWELRPALLPRLLGRAVHRAWRFDSYDQRDPRWWPQGVSTAAESTAHADEPVIAASWYAKDLGDGSHGSRISFVDTDRGRYRHVLLVQAVTDPVHGPTLQPLTIHAGGIAWSGDWLHVAATGRGLFSAHTDDIMRVETSQLRPGSIGMSPDRVDSYGHRFVWPVRQAWKAHADDGHEKLRYSFLATASDAAPPVLLAGEYGRGEQSTRLATFPLDPDAGLPAHDAHGTSRPLSLDCGGVRGMQGVALARGRHHVSVSCGPWTPGTILTGAPGALRPFRWAVPMGPEDLSYRSRDDTLWTVTEHPRRRWLVQMEREWFDR